MREGSERFALDKRLDHETLRQAVLPLCQVLLRDERRYPWVVLVPRRTGVAESFDLLPGDRRRLWEEVDLCAAALKAETKAVKINIAAFGNQVGQLHVHIVGRRKDDDAWPGGVIGQKREPYGSDAVPPFWPRLLSRLPIVERQRP